MLETAVIALRAVQYGGAVVLLGLPLFWLYSFRAGDRTPGWIKPLLTLSAFAVILGAILALVAQTAVMAGSLSDAIKPASLSFMVTGTALGMAYVIRAVTGLVALLLVFALPSKRFSFWLVAILGVTIAASFAWTGHGAATEGAGHGPHLIADILHLIAAAIWLGALAAFTGLLLRSAPSDSPGLHRALAGFSAVGTGAVVVLVVTGAINSYVLVGVQEMLNLTASPYGLLLIVKLALFAVMLLLAARNRFRLTPALGQALATEADTRPTLASLRQCLIAETAAGALLLIVVAVMGTLPPPASL